MEQYKSGNWIGRDGQPKKYRPTGITQMLVHRAVWAWYNGETPYDPNKNLDVCHKHDEVDNNDINNLYVDAHINNIHARKVAGGRYK